MACRSHGLLPTGRDFFLLFSDKKPWNGAHSPFCGHVPCLSEEINCLPTLGGRGLARLVGGHQGRVALLSNLDILLGFCSLRQTRYQVGIGLGQELLQVRTTEEGEEAVWPAPSGLRGTLLWSGF